MRPSCACKNDDGNRGEKERRRLWTRATKEGGEGIGSGGRGGVETARARAARGGGRNGKARAAHRGWGGNDEEECGVEGGRGDGEEAR